MCSLGPAACFFSVLAVDRGRETVLPGRTPAVLMPIAARGIAEDLVKVVDIENGVGLGVFLCFCVCAFVSELGRAWITGGKKGKETGK